MVTKKTTNQMKKKAMVQEDIYRDEPVTKNKQLRFSTSVPPSVNHMYFNTNRGGKILTPDAECYVRDAKALINQAVEDQRWVIPPRDTWLYVDLVFYFPDRRIRDSHNCLKILMDVMQGTIFINDYYAMPRILSVEYDKTNPRVEIHISSQTKREREKALHAMR